MNIVTHKSILPKPDKGRNTRLRAYEAKDIQWIAAVAAAVVPELPHYKGVKVDTGHIEFVLNNNLTNAMFMCSVLVGKDDKPVGGVGGWCTQLFFSKEVSTRDVFLFILPEWRSLLNASKLITSYLEWAHERGAVLIEASYTGGYEPEAMDKLLVRSGFVRVGTLYQIKKGA